MRTELVPLAIGQGFEIHHAQSEYIMLKTWLRSSKSPLPGYANHFIGIGGVVLSEDNKLLVVSERFQPVGFPDTKLRYKLPGGHVDSQESLAHAVVREVFEETGVHVKFDSILCFRHNLLYPPGFGNGDIYFAAKCSPVDDGAINFDHSEIEACEWMPVSNFLADDSVSPFSRHITQLALSNNQFEVSEMSQEGPYAQYYSAGAQLYHGLPLPDNGG
jgi:8-oxo-dGTP pyrophosphatase MutT (NUDIX family)